MNDVIPTTLVEETKKALAPVRSRGFPVTE